MQLKFKTNGLSFLKLWEVTCGWSQMIDKNESWISDVLENIFNADETGWFSKVLPEKKH